MHSGEGKRGWNGFLSTCGTYLTPSLLSASLQGPPCHPLLTGEDTDTQRGRGPVSRTRSHGIHCADAQALDMIRGPRKRHRVEGIQIPTLPFTACWVTLGSDSNLGFLMCKMGTIVTIPANTGQALSICLMPV